MRNKEYIYIVLVRALTGLGKFARTFSDYEYTHIAVMLNPRGDDYATFSRKKHFTPFDSGFMHETLDCYAYGKNRGVKLKIYKVPVSPEAKAAIKDYIKEMEEDRDYIFNIYSMATMSLFHGFKIYKAHNCMSFVAYILKLSGAVEMTKPYYKYSIKDMDELLAGHAFRVGYFRKKQCKTSGYMDRVCICENVKSFVKLNRELIYRIVNQRRLMRNE